MRDGVPHPYKATGKIKFCIFYSLGFYAGEGKTKYSELNGSNDPFLVNYFNSLFKDV
jgi:hypothetical protein